MFERREIQIFAALVLVTGGVFLSGCAKNEPAPAVEKRMIVVSERARAPEGVVRYCWEEPMIDFEKNGPGLDSEGKWYHPSYLAVREVRQGRWRPCTKQ